MSEKIGFAAAVRAGGDDWRVRGLMDNGGILNKKASALYCAYEGYWLISTSGWGDFSRMLEAQEYRLCRRERAPFSMPCLERFRYRLGAVA